MTEADWAALIEGWFPSLADRRLRQVTMLRDGACYGVPPTVTAAA